MWLDREETAWRHLSSDTEGSDRVSTLRIWPVRVVASPGGQATESNYGKRRKHGKMRKWPTGALQLPRQGGAAPRPSWRQIAAGRHLALPALLRFGRPSPMVAQPAGTTLCRQPGFSLYRHRKWRAAVVAGLAAAALPVQAASDVPPGAGRAIPCAWRLHVAACRCCLTR